MALTTAQIQNAYVAFFNRPADVAGLTYWSSYAGSTADLLNTFAQSTEYKGLYSGLNSTQLVNAVYQNLFGHTPDVAGLTYWVTQLDQGKLSIGNIADAINKGAQSTDASIIANKVAAATAFTAALDTTAEVVAYAGVNSTGLEAVKAWLAAVTSDAATVPNTDSVTKIITTVQNNVAASGSNLVLTTAVDNLTGTAGNDTFISSQNGTATLNVADQMDGGAGTDTLKIYSNTTTPASTTNTVPLGLKNIEVLDYVNPVNADINIAALTGVTKLMVEDATGFASILTTGKGVSLSLATAAGAAAGAATWAADNTETSVNLNLNGYQYKTGSPANLTLTGTATTTVNISSTGNSNKIGTLDVGSAVTKLVASGDKSLSFTLAGTDVPNLDSLDSSAMTAGGVSVNLSTATLKAGFTFTGGAGNDVLTLRDDQFTSLTAGSQLDGGAGDDKVVISDTALSATEYKAINALKNFEVLGVNAAVTVDASKLTSIKTFSIDGDNTQTINNMATGSKVWLTSAHSNNINLASATGVNDLALNLVNDQASGDQTIGGTLTIGQTAVALNSSGSSNGKNIIATLANADNSTYTITGAKDLTISNALAGTAIGSKIDASAFTGVLTVTGSAMSDILIGGSGADILNGGAVTAAATASPGVTEYNVVTFGALTAGQTLTLGGLTFTAGGSGATDTQVASAFATLANGGAGNASTAGAFTAGSLTGWSTGAATGNQVTFTSSTPNTNIATASELAITGSGAGASSLAKTDGSPAVTQAIQSLDTLTGNGGSDTFKFSSLDSDGTAGVVTAVITDFKTGVDKIFVLGDDASATAAYGLGSTTNLVKATATAADLSTLLTAADTALTGTIKYYVGQVGSDAYLVTDFDGNGYTNVIKLTGVALDGIVAADLIGA